jgi:hypothetical protein
MSVTKTLNIAVPYIEDGKVVRWRLGMKYEQGTEGQADYYTSDKAITLDATYKVGDLLTHPKILFLIMTM